MRQVIVRRHSDSLVSIVNGESTCIVKMHINCIAVTNLKKNPETGIAHCALYKLYINDENERDIRNEFRRIIGKLSMKREDSKYFGNPIWDEHCGNGTGVMDGGYMKYFEKICEDAIAEVNKDIKER